MKLAYKLLIILLSVISIIVLLYFCVLKKEFKINNIKDSEIIEIDYDSKFKDKKINAMYGNKLLGYKKVKVKNITKKDINTKKLKEYKVKYELKYKNKKKNIIVIYKVVDKEKPVIETEEKEINICPNSEKYNITYKVIDNYDGDITDKAVKRIENDKLIIEATDSNNNYNKYEIKVDYKDEDKPTLKLNGDTTKYLVVGEKYIEKGAVSFDECDGDLTNKIKIEGNVDTSKAGVYEVKYIVFDSHDNKEEITRKVTVYPKNNPDNRDKIIYLTFDDGPYIYTDRLLTILKKYDVKATFFVTNQYPGYRKLIKKEANEGHTVGIHSYTHNYSKVYSSLENYIDDLNKMNEIIKEQTGLYSNIVRLPGGSSNTVSKKYKEGIMTEITAYLDNNNYVYFDWNVASGDAGNTTDTNKIVENVVKYMNGKNNLVVLQHDIKSYSVDAVERIIIEGFKRGYAFKALDSNSYTAHQKITN